MPLILKTKQVWMRSDRGPYGNYTAPMTNSHSKRELEIIQGLVVSTQWNQQALRRTPVLKLHGPGSLDYRAPHGLPIDPDEYATPIFFVTDYSSC